MSDYLWDKTGEPDAETERLENLLGQLRFQPTPFDLPAELPAKPAADELRAVRSRNVLSWPRLAVAASLALAVFTGAWLMLRQQAGTPSGVQQVASQNGQAGAGANHSTAAVNQSAGVAPRATEAGAEYATGGGVKKPEDEVKKPETQAAAPPQGNEARREQLGAGPRRPHVPDLAANTPRRLPRGVATYVKHGRTANAARRQENSATQGVEPARREETARAEREAAEKVLYALRVTSEKLNYARQQVHEAARKEDNR